MKRYLPYLIPILLLSGGLGWYFFTRQSSTLNQSEANFKVAYKERIGKIILHDDKKRTITLEKKDGRWMLNNKFQARQDLTNQLLNVVTRIESQAPVGKAAYQNVLREMLASNIQVQIFYEGENKPERVYYVGGPTLDSKGTYMLMEINGKPAERPHIVRIPGLDAYLTPSYEMEEDMWRSRTVFSLSPEAIQSISIRYPAENMQSFSLEAEGRDSFTLFNYLHEAEPVKQAYLYAYASFFTDVQIENFENENELRTEIVRQTPYAIVEVKSKTGETTSTKLFFMPINRRSKTQFDEQGNEVAADIDKLYISLNNDRDFGVAQIYVWGRVLRTFQDFLKAEQAQPKP